MSPKSKPHSEGQKSKLVDSQKTASAKSDSTAAPARSKKAGLGSALQFALRKLKEDSEKQPPK
jgi:hypothetical protein